MGKAIHLRHPECTYPNPFYGHPLCNVTGVGNPNWRRVGVSKWWYRVSCKKCLKYRPAKSSDDQKKPL